MRKTFAMLALAGMIFSTMNTNVINLQATTVDASVINGKENILFNGDFSIGYDGWGDFTCENGEGEVKLVNGAAEATVTNTGDVNYSLQVYNEGFTLHKGGKYVLKFDISSSIPRQVDYRIQLNGGDYRGYIDGRVDTNSTKQTVIGEFTMKDDTDKAPRLCFNLGKVNDTDLGAHTVTIDNVGVYLIDDSNISHEGEEEVKEQSIILNQVGYLPNDSKRVVFRGDVKDTNFKVVSVSTGETVYTGTIDGGSYNAGAQETTYIGDFSSVKEAGTYKIETDSLGESYTFKIGDDVYKDVLRDAVRMFYLQRCGEVLPEQYAGNLHHDKCHTTMATIYGTSEKIDVSGGWHDAGDYGRYVIATSKTIGDLLTAYNLNPSAFGDDTNIPESGNGTPDILDEVKGQLEWLFKMQNKSNGGVYHKVTCKDFPSYVMPEEETAPLIVCPITTTATGDFAAVMAMGYEAFKDTDSNFANQCLAAAEKAWDYLVQQPSQVVTNPAGIVTGEYGDKKDTDERYWAAAALFKATGKSKYNDAFKQIAGQGIETGYDWQNVGSFGNDAYLAANGADSTICEKIKSEILGDANNILVATKNDAYGTANGTNFYWGSNMSILNDAIIMQAAHTIAPNEEYIDYAKEHVNYCFGKNALATSFVTGYGTVTPKNLHHRPSMVRGVAPGMIAGGVNSQLEDNRAKIFLKDAAPAKCYLDDQESYSTNEVDIYWNSALVHALSRLNLVSDASSEGGNTGGENQGGNQSGNTGEGNQGGNQSGNTGSGEGGNQGGNSGEEGGEITENPGLDVQVKTQANGNGVGQTYTVNATGDAVIDVSKVAIRYYFEKVDAKEMKFWCDCSSAQLNVAPWYVDLTSGTKGEFGSDSKGDYIEITFARDLELRQGQGSLNIQARLTNSDWSNLEGFEGKDTVIYYDGNVINQ